MDSQLLSEVKESYQQLLENGQLGDALPLIRQAAHWADLDAQILAERIYVHGLYGHPRSLQAGYEYATLAALNGDVTSMADLGQLYLDEHFDHKDVQKAHYWLSKAAAARHPDALDALGMMYLQARGVKRDLLRAISCFEQAQQAGLVEPAGRHLKMARKMLEKKQMALAGSFSEEEA